MIARLVLGHRLARRRQAQQGQTGGGDANVLSKTLQIVRDGWNANTGKLKLTFKRPSQIYPALGLTDN
jgi:hypothetical protein